MPAAILLCLLLLAPEENLSQEAQQFKGQISTYAGLNNASSQNYSAGFRYIPQYNLSFPAGAHIVDAEISINAYHNFSVTNSETPYNYGRIKPYRLWLRYSGEQFELRGGLQKINFGSATILRPLMWFDKLDPRDPLQMTDGVYAILARYYLLDNSNIWLWGLYGNDDLKTWEISKTSKINPEFGGRIQSPFYNGEAGITFHQRKTDIPIFPGMPASSGVTERKIGLDGKWDIEAGMWVETAWINRDAEIGLLRNQELVTLGTDYTFETGNGINIMAEHLIAAADEKPFQFKSTSNFTAIHTSYPLTMIDMVSAIAYYDWDGKYLYSFITWQMTWDNLLINIMAFRNPDSFNLPQQNENRATFSGKGIQIIFAYNH